MLSATALAIVLSYLFVFALSTGHAHPDVAALDARTSFGHLRAEAYGHDELMLTDTVLLASVDGQFHAINRTNGAIKWTMDPSAQSHSPSDPRPPLHNLVRSVHLQRDDDADGSEFDAEETYIIEPQSGQIFVLPPGASQSTPLEKLPFTIPKLVDLSPFRLPVNGEQRMFLGRKETSLITLDIDTGAVVAMYDASSCIWDAKSHQPSSRSASRNVAVDLEVDDEDAETSLYDPYSDTFRRSRARRREVIIGRTDYHISVLIDGKGVVQTLTFSVYGPNNIDRDRQERWAKSPDGRYVQPLPDGRLFFFEPRGNRTELSQWVLPFNKPIVAIFDVLHPPSSPSSPLVLAQPSPSLLELFSDPKYRKELSLLEERTYVGIIGESLFAMSHESYPLVSFPIGGERFGASISSSRRPQASSGQDVEETDLAIFVERECTARGCLVGTHSSSGFSASSRYARLIEGSSPRALIESATSTAAAPAPSRYDYNPREHADANPDSDNHRSQRASTNPNTSDLPYLRKAGDGSVWQDVPRIAAPPPSTPFLEYVGILGIGRSDGYPAGLKYGFQGGLLALCAVLGYWFIALGKAMGGDSRHGRNGGLTAPHAATAPTVHPNQMPVLLPSIDPPQSQPLSLPNPSLTSSNPGPSNTTSSSSTNQSSVASISKNALLPSLPLPPSATDPSSIASSPSQPPAQPQVLAPTPTADDADAEADGDDAGAEGPGPDGVVGKRRRKNRGHKKRGGAKAEAGVSSVSGEATAAPIPIPNSELVSASVSESPTGHVERSVSGVEELVSSSPLVPAAAASTAAFVALPTPPTSPPVSTPVPVPVVNANANGDGPANGNLNDWTMVPALGASGGSIVIKTTPAPVAPPSLEVSDEIIGQGSAGTTVFKGSFQGRPVAVKRLLLTSVTVAYREVSLLQESDDHPNVIRYYFQERQKDFLYIALELCPASLEDIITHPHEHVEIIAAFQAKKALAQIAAGLGHLHSLKIVHRDIKPQNILVSAAGRKGGHRMLISDFGLCKKLEADQTGFYATHNGRQGAGTVGWRAPEILRREVSLDVFSPENQGSGEGSGSIGSNGIGGGDSTIGSVGTVNGKDPTSTSSSKTTNGAVTGRTRLTKSVDIFALGCLLFYTLTNGKHPYDGDDDDVRAEFERESNILKDAKNLSLLDMYGEEGEEAKDLINRMLDQNPKSRPDTSACLVHPFFWTPGKRLAFLQDASDRFEIMERDPPEKGLVALETGAYEVVGLDWHKRLDKIFIDNLGKYRKYNGKSVQDLLRALRNKKHHYQDLPDNVKRHLGPLPDGFLAYFTRRFPLLFLHVYYVIANSPMLRMDSMFHDYFDRSDS